MINRIIGKLVESDNALVDRKRVNIREALNKIDCEHYTDFLNLYECANLPLDKKKALAQELVKEEVDLKVIESFFDKALLETGEWVDDEEGLAWKKQLVDLIHKYTDFDNIEIEDVNGFDKYQGPYVYDSGLEIWTHPESMNGLLIHDMSYTINSPAWYAIFSREDFENFKKGNLMPVEESLEENNSFTESVLPRNAKTITATSRYDGTSTKLTKKDGVWSDGKQGYGNSFLRNNYDIKVDEIDKDYKPKRTKEVAVLQGNYGYGWDDLITYEKGDPDIRTDLKSYRENEPGVAHRVIYRRIPVDTQE